MTRKSPNFACMVPICERRYCNAIIKKSCALRRYFLIEIKERKQKLAKLQGLVSKTELKELHKEAYFWKVEQRTKRTKEAK